MNFDVLVIGAGPAGLNAADVASMHGATVAVVDDNALPGGQVWRQGPQQRPSGPARALLTALAARPNVTLLNGVRVVQVLSPRTLLVEHAGEGKRVGYGKLIVATGARERFLPFPGWTLPGVTGAGGLQALIKAGMPVKGQRIVIAGSGPLLWAAAMTARAHGAHIVALVEQAPAAAVGRFARSLVLTPAKLLQAARMRIGLWATPYLRDAYVAEATGAGRVKQVRVRHRGRERLIDCDRLACAYGLLPNTGVAATLGCRIELQAGVQAIAVDPWQATSVPGVFAAGECTGVGGMELSAVEGRIAGLAAIGENGRAEALFAERTRYRRFARRVHEAFDLSPALRSLAGADTLLCRCEDVPYAQVARYVSWRDAKLHTRCGMGPCQGKVCAPAAAFCFGWNEEGERPLRPPYSPTRIETLLQADGGEA
ncbi:FAD-dependent oxidoreductase [Cupriavidus necator]|uniref:FAD-dependent oxidoreductase n=1 Tax=Cupriavidus necator TaxID=106590 RepID=UPI0039C0F09F